MPTPPLVSVHEWLDSSYSPVVEPAILLTASASRTSPASARCHRASQPVTQAIAFAAYQFGYFSGQAISLGRLSPGPTARETS